MIQILELKFSTINSQRNMVKEGCSPELQRLDKFVDKQNRIRDQMKSDVSTAKVSGLKLVSSHSTNGRFVVSSKEVTRHEIKKKMRKLDRRRERY